MSDVIVAAIGTRGDVAPLTGVAARLAAGGHRVVLAAHAAHEELVRSCGLEFVRLGGPADPGALARLAEHNPLQLMAASLGPRTVRQWGEELLTGVRDRPADVLLLSPWAEYAGWSLAEARGIPALGLRLQPLSATATGLPAVVGGGSVGGPGNLALTRLGTAALDRLYAGAVADTRHRLGLPAASPRTLRRRRTAAGVRVLHGYSPAVVPRPPDWRTGLDVVGYWWPDRPAGWRPDPELTAFLAAGPPPVFLGLGSLLLPRARAERLSELAVAAFARAGVRGVVQAGWAGLRAAADDVLTVGDVPHDWLFPRCAAVVHACGAGTTAAGLRAGVPAVAVPAAGDQPFWAGRLAALGVSAGTLRAPSLTVEGMAAAIRTAVEDAALRERARALAADLAAEDGAGAVLAAVEAAVGASA